MAIFFKRTGSVLWKGIKGGQSVLEYAILLAIVAAAFITMSIYVRRAIQGQLYSLEDKVTAKAVAPAAPGAPPIVI